jgi:hypothetical protein
MPGTLEKSSDDKIKIYETVLSSPGMAAKCKIMLQLSRRDILLLSSVIETGLEPGKNETGSNLAGFLPEECVDDLKVIVAEILKKAELTEFYEKLKML